MKKAAHVENIRDAILEPKLVITRGMARALLATECPAAIAYYLRANPEISEAIADSSDSADEIEKIEKAWRSMNAEMRSGWVMEQLYGY